MDFTSSKSSSSNIEYNGVKFSQDQYGYWTFNIQGYSFQMQYLPKDTENISVQTSKTINDYNTKPLYFSAEPEEELPSDAVNEISRNMQYFAQRMNPACISQNCSLNYPVKNCSNDYIIVFKKSSTNSTKITDREKCALIEYSEFQEIQASDGFLYKIFGIK